MLTRFCVLSVWTVAAWLMASDVHAADRAAKTQVCVELALYEETAPDSRKILSSPRVVVMLGQKFSLHIGGQLMDKKGKDGIEFGTGFHGKIKRQGPDKLLLRLKLTQGNAVDIADAPEIQLVRTEVFEVRTPVTIGKVMRIPCGESQTLELRIHPVALPADQPNARP